MRDRVAGSTLLLRHPLARGDFRRRGAKILFFSVRRVRAGDEPESARQEKESEQGHLQQNR